MKKEENRRKRDEERRKEEEQKQKQWEEEMLQQLDVHPYIEKLEWCDQLIKYCQKNLPKDESGKEVGSVITEQDRKEAEEKRQKTISEAVDKGKLMRAMTKEEREKEDNIFKTAAKEEKKKEKRKKENSMWYQDDPDKLDVDIGIIQIFGKLIITAPLYKSDLQKALDDLNKMKVELQEKGEAEKERKKKQFIQMNCHFTKLQEEQEEGEDNRHEKKYEVNQQDYERRG